jgi:NADPH:quinone reductase-like Zn-dependent oxidoreductase
MGFNKPKRSILGIEFSGVIEAIGKDVSLFKVDDKVLASTFWSDFGAYAEYKCMAEDGMIILKPSKLTFEEAAAGIASGGLTAIDVLTNNADIQKGQKVLIYGASGSVGTFALQIAKSFGAEVIGVCSTKNIEMVKSLGADKVIDYTKEDFTQKSEKYDLIFDAVDKISSKQCKPALKETGKYLNVAKDTSSQKKITIDLLKSLKKLVETGKLKPVIDKSYPMDQIVEAHMYVDKGHKKGNLVIIVDKKSKTK